MSTKHLGNIIKQEWDGIISVGVRENVKVEEKSEN